MGIKCAIVCMEETLLYQAMASLLADDAGLDVIPILAHSRNALFSAVDKIQPDIVILINVNEEANNSILYQLLHNYPDIHLVTVGIDEKQMYVYPDRKLIHKPAELLSMIHSV